MAAIASVAPGVLIALRSITDATLEPSAGITRSLPLYSQLTTKVVRSAVKSAWLTPRHGTCSECCSFIVCGSRKSMRSRASAITIACLPSGLKYRLYGSSTGTERPGLPVAGSTGVSMLPLLSLTHRVFMSHEGTTCCGCAGTGNCSTTLKVFGSMTSTRLLPRSGT